MTTTQNTEILAHLKSGKSITGLQAAVKYGVGHLPRRIKDLKDRGVQIEDQMIQVQKRNGKKVHVKEYWMVRA